MTVTNRATGEQINLADILNSKLEAPLLQSEMGLDAIATALGHAVRWNEWSVKHNNDGTFKSGIIDQADVGLTTAASSTKKPIRWDEFSVNHNDDGSFKTGVVGNVEVDNNAGIVASKLAIQKNYKKSVGANPSSTAGAYGTAVVLSPSTGYVALNPLAIDIDFGGTFGTETVTAQFKVTFSDGTTANVLKTATATGVVSFTNSDIMNLIKDGVYINQISVSSKSDISSSSATVTFNHYGFYL